MLQLQFMILQSEKGKSMEERKKKKRLGEQQVVYGWPGILSVLRSFDRNVG